MLHKVQLDYLQFLEEGCEGRETEAKTLLRAVKAACIKALEHSSPSPQVYSARARDQRLDKVVIEILNQERPGKHAEEEVLVYP